MIVKEIKNIPFAASVKALRENELNRNMVQIRALSIKNESNLRRIKNTFIPIKSILSKGFLKNSYFTKVRKRPGGKPFRTYRYEALL